jgi:hypothetical protein
MRARADVDTDGGCVESEGVGCCERAHVPEPHRRGGTTTTALGGSVLWVAVQSGHLREARVGAALEHAQKGRVSSRPGPKDGRHSDAARTSEPLFFKFCLSTLRGRAERQRGSWHHTRPPAPETPKPSQTKGKARAGDEKINRACHTPPHSSCPKKSIRQNSLSLARFLRAHTCMLCHVICSLYLPLRALAERSSAYPSTVRAARRCPSV